MKIIVLLGGESAERRVSLASGEAVAGALSRCGHEVYKVDLLVPVRLVPAAVPLFNEAVGEEPPEITELPRFSPRRLAALMETLDNQHPDVVFPMLHGGMGEDGRLQAALEMVGIPFVGSGSLAASLAMHKPLAKCLFHAAGVPTPDSFVISRRDGDPEVVARKIRSSFGFPVVIKPDSLGSAVGLSILQDEKELNSALNKVIALGYEAMVETYIPGHELTVTVLEQEALPPIEIKPHAGVYDYLSKYTKGHTDYLCPAPITDEQTNHLKILGLKAHRALGCRHYSRVDFRMDENGEIFCLEVNTIPGMTATSLVPKAAAAAGFSFEELVDKLVRIATT